MAPLFIYVFLYRGGRIVLGVVIFSAGLAARLCYLVYFRIPIWIFVQLPIYVLLRSERKAVEFWQKGYGAATDHRVLAGTVILCSYAGFFLVLGRPFFEAGFDMIGSGIGMSFIGGGIMSVAGLLMWLLPAVFGFVSFTFAAKFFKGDMDAVAKAPSGSRGSIIPHDILETFNNIGRSAEKHLPLGGSMLRSKMNEASDLVADRAKKEARQAGKKGVNQAMKEFEKQAGKQTVKKAAGQAAKQGARTAATSVVGEGSAVAGAGGAVGASGGTILIVIVAILWAIFWSLVFLVAIGFVVFFWTGVIITVVYFTFLYFTGPYILGFAAGILGVGEHYTSQFEDRHLAGIETEFAPLQGVGFQVSNRASCYINNPMDPEAATACYRQWAANNTQRPTSKAVGDKFGLEIDGFEVGQGERIEVGRRGNMDHQIPVSFRISNPRYGVYGIPAENVSYRIRVIDSDQEYCDTGWRGINAHDARGVEDRGKEFTGNDLYPGTATAGTRYLVADEELGDGLTFRDCEMLQPSLGVHRTVMMEVKYDYESESVLDFRAMDEEHLVLTEEITTETRVAETADTPVQAALEVESPVTYFEDMVPTENPIDASDPFAVDVGLNSDRFGIRYQVQGIVFEKSNATEPYENMLREQEEDDPGPYECAFDKEVEGENMMELDSSVADTLLKDDEGNRIWFETYDEPDMFPCWMMLSNPDDISQTGETLRMRALANYTVAVEERMDSFEIYNRHCGSRYNCPLLVTEQYNGSDKEGADYPWMTECSGIIDTRIGCTAVSGPSDGEHRWDRTPLEDVDGREARIESREVAIDLVWIKEDFVGYNFGPGLAEILGEDDVGDITVDDHKQEVATGIDPDDWEFMSTGEDFILLETGGEVEVEEGVLCEETLQEYEEDSRTRLLGYTADTDCGDGSGEGSEDGAALTGCDSIGPITYCMP